MTKINLLPWRLQKREQEKKEFMLLLVLSTIMAMAFVVVINYHAGSLIDGQARRNQRLQEEITKANGQITEITMLKQNEEVLISRLRIVYEMQVKRFLIIHLFNELITVLPDGIYLTHIKRIEDNVLVQGYSVSSSEVSMLMRNIANNQWIQEPVLTQIKKANDRAAFVSNAFNLSFILKPKNPAP